MSNQVGSASAARNATAQGEGTSTSNAPAATKPATIYDVAQAAGVSHQTVSRYLKGYAGIRPETRSRVERALEELSYRPNLTARSLTTGRSHRIGALTHEIAEFGPSKILGAAAEAAREAGYVLDIVTLDTSDVRRIDEALDLLTKHDLAGVLALSSTDEMTRAFTQVDFRVPSAIAAEPDEPFVAESPLATVGMPALIAHLLELGHERLLHVSGPSQWSAARNRRRVIEDQIAASGAELVAVVEGDWSARSGYDAINSLDAFSATAVIAANDQMALGAMLALKERGLEVPADVSVAGVDDIPDAAFYSPPLTTLKMDFAAQGRAALLDLIGRIEGVAAPAPESAGASLVVRASTSRVRR